MGGVCRDLGRKLSGCTADIYEDPRTDSETSPSPFRRHRDSAALRQQMFE